ncbi:MAG: nitroreductase family protein [Candidatus Coatesbacteria bacterium]|nr:nitroreductase family protein [Candidatus Coatesbacteria bacterium]
MESIYKRRSIRKFKDKEIEESIILEIIKAGMYAPSAGNQQPWQFLVITEREKLNRIPDFHEYSKMLYSSPAAILVCADLLKERITNFFPQDCSASTENMLIAATSMGLGSVWLGVYPVEKRIKGFKTLFNLPETIIPFSLVALGYPDEEKTLADRYDSSRIHFNKW